MSSWIPSLFNTNQSRDLDSDYETSSSPSRTPRAAASGVKDDLSAVFRGVAAFLAPREGSSSLAVSSSAPSDAIAGIKSDLAEIQGSLKSGLSLISSKLTSNFLQFQGQHDDDDGDEVEQEVEEEDEDGDALGITEAVVDFVRKLSARPELWIDFPLPLEDDFDMSDYQRDHAANIDYLVPELVTLRQKISSQITEGKFWIIYFILLFPRLSEEDLKLLSAPQVVEARETLLKKLQNKSNTMQETSENHNENPEINRDTDQGHISEGDESKTQHKSASAEIASANKPMDNNTTEEEKGSYGSADARNKSESEDISFSDLEDDDDDVRKKVLASRLLNKGEASEWIQLNENSGGQVGKKKAGGSTLPDKGSESEDSNDWLAVDDKDFDNLGAI
ncbi:protein starmaker-like [Dorcoceras hygrometricum]|uniref:Protein starmaker-like n=1 Tax=Dorcoceras hygrometricum TaxID=472368 RepID=A0A2Z6ZY13_9LAMI|nr:protein starmaker-like [Dorcoceras hygrometricum]